MISWRIAKAKYAAEVMSGHGAEKYGGRWNSSGRPVVYTSCHQSLAALETLVHLNPPVALDYVIVRLEFHDSMINVIQNSDLPKNWRSEPPPPACQSIGNTWIKESRHAVLAIPSIIIPDEINYLINPRHPDFGKIKVSKPKPFNFDRRLI
ncbi:MAG: RES family NAD+ phosphorylase [Armatimonadetes bacterium]|nr:RES family NAD+ phosphorylase [Akkermansiaceae bacterium]